VGHKADPGTSPTATLPGELRYSRPPITYMTSVTWLGSQTTETITRHIVEAKRTVEEKPAQPRQRWAAPMLSFLDISSLGHVEPYSGFAAPMAADPRAPIVKAPEAPPNSSRYRKGGSISTSSLSSHWFSLRLH
jgi:hypothetical protein